MKNNEIEIVKYPIIKHVRILYNAICFKEDHIHNEIEIGYLIKGKAKVINEGVEYNLNQGDIFLINSGDIHSYRMEDQNFIDQFRKTGKITENESLPVFLFVQVSNHFVREYFPQLRTTIFKRCIVSEKLNSETKKSFIRQLNLVAYNYFSMKENSPLKIVGELCNILSIIFENVEYQIIDENQRQKLKAKKARLERIISYIDENFDTQIRLEDIAKSEGLTVTHFSHLFSSSFNVTFIEFVGFKRLEQCLRLMKNKEKSLLEISYESGFSDPKYMNKMFMKNFNCTAKEYRKKLNDQNLSDNELETNSFEYIYNDIESFNTAKKLLEESK